MRNSILYTLRYKDGIYMGQTLSGRYKQGIGVYLWENGSAFYGEWKSDHIDGIGILFLPPRTQVQGHFKAGQLEGPVTIKTRNFTFEGSWRNGFPDGQITAKGKENEVTITFQDGKPARQLSGRKALHLPSVLKTCACDGGFAISILNLLEGTFYGIVAKTNGKSYLPHGLGILVKKDDNFDSGNYQDGLLEGIGRVQRPDGSIYQGELSRGKSHGRGILLYRKEELLWVEGQWRFGDLHELLQEGPVSECKNPRDLMFPYGDRKNNAAVKQPVGLGFVKQLEDIFMQQLSKQEPLSTSLRRSEQISSPGRLSYYQRSTLQYLQTHSSLKKSQLLSSSVREIRSNSDKDQQEQPQKNRQLLLYYKAQLSDIALRESKSETNISKSGPLSKAEKARLQSRKPNLRKGKQGHNKQAKSFKLIQPQSSTPHVNTAQHAQRSRVSNYKGTQSSGQLLQTPRVDLEEIKQLTTQFQYQGPPSRSQIYEAILDNNDRDPQTSRLDNSDHQPQSEGNQYYLKLQDMAKFQKSEGHAINQPQFTIPSRTEKSDAHHLGEAKQVKEEKHHFPQYQISFNNSQIVEQQTPAEIMHKHKRSQSQSDFEKYNLPEYEPEKVDLNQKIKEIKQRLMIEKKAIQKKNSKTMPQLGEQQLKISPENSFRAKQEMIKSVSDTLKNQLRKKTDHSDQPPDLQQSRETDHQNQFYYALPHAQNVPVHHARSEYILDAKKPTQEVSKYQETCQSQEVPDVYVKQALETQSEAPQRSQGKQEILAQKLRNIQQAQLMASTLEKQAENTAVQPLKHASQHSSKSVPSHQSQSETPTKKPQGAQQKRIEVAHTEDQQLYQDEYFSPDFLRDKHVQDEEKQSVHSKQPSQSVSEGHQQKRTVGQFSSQKEQSRVVSLVEGQGLPPKGQVLDQSSVKHNTQSSFYKSQQGAIYFPAGGHNNSRRSSMQKEDDNKSQRNVGLSLQDKSQHSVKSFENLGPVSHRNVENSDLPDLMKESDSQSQFNMLKYQSAVESQKEDVSNTNLSYKERAVLIFKQYAGQLPRTEEKGCQAQPVRQSQEVQTHGEGLTEKEKRQLKEVSGTKQQQQLDSANVHDIKQQLAQQREILSQLYNSLQETKMMRQSNLELYQTSKKSFKAEWHEDTIKKKYLSTVRVSQPSFYSPSRGSIRTIQVSHMSPTRVIVTKGMQPAFTIVRPLSPPIRI